MDLNPDDFSIEDLVVHMSEKVLFAWNKKLSYYFWAEAWSWSCLVLEKAGENEEKADNSKDYFP